ncbi:MmcQ/YjbR family DNA-binding protein [Microvirga arsenatis]|uniref:MmcQ/YjbR family DNA-binding protein n=1 Tax=Microvirga arsenatis TaxID=2692265 RepID=A0ABW9Z1V6_9HYPH|nr:MmcQ/YjbR family DNA-binding protein [Microvirga arsenatis]NBJ12638.1 MmcQ/YjbR family DNA-binding protein [Microvirga arsenatis]NBJ26497.1 MmcQ/YjbR family DNA-binding protein [Microvirga arsenatis]
MTPDDVRRLALALPETSESAHMDRPDFRVRSKIFATLHLGEHRAVVKLTPEDQQIRVEAEPLVFAPVPGKWGLQGWTNVNLTLTDEVTLQSALFAAWSTVAPKSLVMRAAGSAPAASTGRDRA